jgi:glycosyltransferase involved in cell wall biosynthesis
MKISLITTTFNSAETLRDTLESVRLQEYNDIEYVIVDGGSTDGTMDLIAEFKDIVSASVSEKDDGIYDALNKGIAMATGEVVGFLHSDDMFADAKVLSRIAEAFSHPDVDATYCDLDYVLRDDPSKIHRQWRSQEFDPEAFYRGWMPAHPTFYLKKEHYTRFGGYDTTFRQSADYELMLRMLLKHGLKAKYIPEVLVKMRVGGASNVSLQNRWQANQEDARAWKKNGLKAGKLTRVMKPLSKLGQFLGRR